MLDKLAYSRVWLTKIIYRLWVPHLYKDKQQRKHVLKTKIYNTEKKYLQRYLYALDSRETPVHDCPKIIWFCWLQGIENAPEVVQKCHASLQKYCPDFDIKVITLDNLKSYIKIPDYIWKKHISGIIPRTQFSDLVRLFLLDQQGGYWLDSTVFLTDKLPQEILNANFFAYHSTSLLKNNNWFLKAGKGNLIIRNILNLLTEYWKHENHLIDYFIYHLFFDLMMEKDEKLAQLWAQTPLLYDDCYALEYSFFKPYDAQLWHKIKTETSIHKLSYRYDHNKPYAGTFLEKLMQDQLEG